MSEGVQHVVALILFGAGAVIALFGDTRYSIACISGGLFVQAL